MSYIHIFLQSQGSLWAKMSGLHCPQLGMAIKDATDTCLTQGWCPQSLVIWLVPKLVVLSVR